MLNVESNKCAIIVNSIGADSSVITVAETRNNTERVMSLSAADIRFTFFFLNLFTNCSFYLSNFTFQQVDH